MKRSVTWMAAVVVLGAVAYVGSSLGAKPAPPAVPAQTRVAMLNLRWVIKNYVKYQEFIDALQKEEKSYRDALQQKQEQVDAFRKQADKLQGEAREAKEQEIVALQKAMEDLKEKARKSVTAKSNEGMAEVYKAVREAASQYAKANNIDLMLHYEGAVNKDEADSPMLVTRNMNAGGAVPLYWNPHLDSSAAVLNALNASYKRGK